MNVPASDTRFFYAQHKSETDAAIAEVLASGIFIGGPTVQAFERELGSYLDIRNVIGCANGTDALQLALMALNPPKGSKIIVPAFTYIAPAEVITLLGYTPVYCDVDPETFNCTAETIAAVYTDDVKAIIPVHLFGQHCNMKDIEAFALEKKCFIIEDNAQSIAAEKNLSGSTSLITTSFFPTKNLSCFGDGGAVLCNDDALSQKIREIANHGQSSKYTHHIPGINSRLDALQAAILRVKLKYLDENISKRQTVAKYYDENLQDIDAIRLPAKNSTHTYHQYTIKTGINDQLPLRDFLHAKNIPATIYYPVPVYQQQAYADHKVSLPNTEMLCRRVLSLPMHTALDKSTLSYICENIRAYFKK